VTIEALYQAASIRTANDLRSLATTAQLRELSRLSLPEIERLTEEIARVTPAGNVPSMILGGLARLTGRKIDPAESHRHVQMLFRGVQTALDEAVYRAFFAGPAAVIYAYQQLLRLAGKDVDSAFPDGTWQFYLEFALREDSARHANETTGFHEGLAQQRLRLSSQDMLAAWVIAAAYFLRQLPDILTNAWREAVALRLIADAAEIHQMTGAAAYRGLHAVWEQQRPYRRGPRAGQQSFAAYRRGVFDAFLGSYYEALPPEVQQEFTTRFRQAEQTDLPAYLRQMSWLAYLEPGVHSETRRPYPLEKACVGVIWQGRYYLLPVGELFDPEAVRATTAAMLTHRPAHPPARLDDVLVIARRAEHPALRKRLDAATQRELDLLRYAPILINWDERDARQPLAAIRRGKRGLGDHALTIFRTAESIVLDQSHIFFDGAWGAEVAEMMTNEALAWAQYLAHLPPCSPAKRLPYSPALQVSEQVVTLACKAVIGQETTAETDAIQIKPIQSLRRLLKQRSELAQVTVNDLFILYRGLHALRYRPSQSLQRALDSLAKDRRAEARRAHALIQDSLERLRAKNPAILIPVDARRQDPRERLFPTTFRNPFTDFLARHEGALDALKAYRASRAGNRNAAYQAFSEAQLYYLRLIGGFGELLRRYKNVALAGQSTSTATIKLLGNLPAPLQRLLDAVPGKIDLLNEVIKGEEVFSNIGRVAKGASLRRFITAKDDNAQKTLVWAVIPDDHDVVRLSLRDFRPHVEALHRLGMDALAQAIAQDYLDAYAEGLNRYIAELREITTASRETPSGKWR
jgi:hypothetical protein